MAAAEKLLIEGIRFEPPMSRDEWLERREDGIGASESAAVLGLSPWMTPLQLYAVKVGKPVDEKDAAAEKEYLEWGLALEKPILDRWARETGRAVVSLPHYTCAWAQQPVDRDGKPFIFASPDALARWPDGVIGVVEAKTTSAFQFREHWEHGEAPINYQIQIQQQMFCTGLKRGSFALLVDGRRFFWLDVERDDAFIERRLIPELAKFRQRIIDRDPPQPTGDDGEKQAIDRLFPHELSAGMIELDAGFAADDEIAVKNAAAIKELEKAREAALNRIRMAVGEAPGGILPNGIRYTLRTQHRDSYTVKASDARVLRRIAPKEDR